MLIHEIIMVGILTQDEYNSNLRFEYIWVLIRCYHLFSN